MFAEHVPCLQNVHMQWQQHTRLVQVMQIRLTPRQTLLMGYVCTQVLVITSPDLIAEVLHRRDFDMVVEVYRAMTRVRSQLQVWNIFGSLIVLGLVRPVCMPCMRQQPRTAAAAPWVRLLKVEDLPACFIRHLAMKRCEGL